MTVKNDNTYICSCKGFMNNGFVCSHVLAVLHVVKSIDINSMLSRLAARSLPGRPPERASALLRSPEALSVESINAAKWRHQPIIRSGGAN